MTGRPGTDSGAGHSSRAGLVAGGAVGLVLCAVVGALGGYLLADGDAVGPGQGAGPVATSGAATPTKTSRAATPARTPTSRPPTTPPPIGGMQLPDLRGQDFREARLDLRSRGLGVEVVFGGAGTDSSIHRTVPQGGSTVKRGITVKLYVVGGPPPVVVPEVVGQSCRQAARQLVDEGLYPRYPSGESGQVREQDPPAGSTLSWNDQVRLHCGTAGTPTGVPTS
ncbi:PASTA domain-containing protein [Plantactinospora sonchi]|uniref:PASTA domain-containing protein n=1 Tax=Plantactinospora sonchi TaxID=1544735 RepID=A0ABU7RPX5_9ACTN